jgi:hypothetical protein
MQKYFLGTTQPCRMPFKFTQFIHLSVDKTTDNHQTNFYGIWFWRILKKEKTVKPFQFLFKSHNLMTTSGEGLLTSLWVFWVKPDIYWREKCLKPNLWRKKEHILCSIYTFSLGLRIFQIIKQKYCCACISKLACSTIMACWTKSQFNIYIYMCVRVCVRARVCVWSLNCVKISFFLA